MPANQYEKAAEEIVGKYGKWLCSEKHGNQDEDCLISTIALIIKKHCGGLPLDIQEALNSGDGTYKP